MILFKSKKSIMMTSLSMALATTLVQSKTVEYTWTLKPRRASPKNTTLSLDCNLDRLVNFVPWIFSLYVNN